VEEVLAVLGTAWHAEVNTLRRDGIGRHAGHVVTDLVMSFTRESAGRTDVNRYRGARTSSHDVAEWAQAGYVRTIPSKGGVMAEDNTLSRHEVFEQIRASELARGASEDDAARVAAEKVDKVMELKRAE
jgi:hypothetical protein